MNVHWEGRLKDSLTMCALCLLAVLSFARSGVWQAWTLFCHVQG